MKKVVHTEQAPAAIGPYSQAMICNGMVYVSGQLPLNHETMQFPAGITAKSEQSLANLQAVLEEAGAGLNAFKVLGGSYVLGNILADNLKVDIADIDFNKSSEQLDAPITIATATAGNYGTNISWAARYFGLHNPF